MAAIPIRLTCADYARLAPLRLFIGASVSGLRQWKRAMPSLMQAQSMRPELRRSA
jgi:hypothetical protein